MDATDQFERATRRFLTVVKDTLTLQILTNCNKFVIKYWKRKETSFFTVGSPLETVQNGTFGMPVRAFFLE